MGLVQNMVRALLDVEQQQASEGIMHEIVAVQGAIIKITHCEI